MISVRLDPEIEDRLADIARRTGKTKSECVREALAAYVEDCDDIHVALARLESPSKLWTLEALEAELDLAG